MQSIQTGQMISLSQVKPLEGLLRFRKFCLDAAGKALSGKTVPRETSPIDQGPLAPWGKVEGLEYRACPRTGSLFLSQVASIPVWGELLQEVSAWRRSSQNLGGEIQKSRRANVFEPKLHWIQNTLRLQERDHPSILEVATPPGEFTPLLKESGLFSCVTSVSETDLLLKKAPQGFDAAVLLETLDRVGDPALLLQNARGSLKEGGLLFVTALVSSGFDMTVLKDQNAYLFPPDRTNCFSLSGLKQLVTRNGFSLLEVSTPGVLDLEVVQAHRNQKVPLALSSFEEQILGSDEETQRAFQTFLQECCLSSFARLVARKS